jgi:hypothetical protein
LVTGKQRFVPFTCHNRGNFDMIGRSGNFTPFDRFFTGAKQDPNRIAV